MDEILRMAVIVLIVILVAVVAALCVFKCHELWQARKRYHEEMSKNIARLLTMLHSVGQQLQIAPDFPGQRVVSGQADLSAVVSKLQPLTQLIAQVKDSIRALQEIPQQQVKIQLSELTELHKKAADCDKARSDHRDCFEAYEKASNELEIERQKRESELRAAKEEIAQLEKAKEEALVQNESLKSAVATVEAERNELRSHSQRLAASLPVADIERIYCAVMDNCAVTDTDASNLRYVFSQIAVLAATRSLDIDPGDKPILLRDAFNAFDLALYARFKREKDRLQSLREGFSDLLKPLLAGALVFEWPAPGNDLDLKRHKQEEENGLGVIREVKSAVLFTNSGAVIAKAVVLT